MLRMRLSTTVFAIPMSADIRRDDREDDQTCKSTLPDDLTVSAQLTDEHHGHHQFSHFAHDEKLRRELELSDSWRGLSQLVHSASKDLRRFVGLRHLTALLP